MNLYKRRGSKDSVTSSRPSKGIPGRRKGHELNDLPELPKSDSERRRKINPEDGRKHFF